MSFIGSLSSSAGHGVFHAGETAAVFASDITRRITPKSAVEAADSTDATDVSATAGQSAKAEQLQKLESSLADTISYMAKEHGEKAGTAAMALIYKRIGDGDVTEESLGNALLDVTRFIDGNFGTDSGDRFMEHLNGSLNESLNAYFENGQNETFFAVNGPDGAISGTGLVLNTAQDNARQAADSILSIIEAARKSMEESMKRPSNPYEAMLQGEEALQPGLLMDAMA